MTQAEAIVQHMMENDAYSKWLGVEVVRCEAGFVKLKMTVRKEMTNGHNTAHGGITYGLSDSALAFASNGHGRKAVSIETSINHLAPVFAGDELTLEGKEVSLNHKIGVYEMRCANQKGELVSLFRGTVYRKSEEWDVNF